MAKRTDTTTLRDSLTDAHRRLVASVAGWTEQDGSGRPDAGEDAEVWSKLPPPELLEGDAPPGLWDFLAAKVRSAGFALRRGHCDGNDGLTDNRERVVWISPDLSDAQACDTLAHELAHVVLHCGQDTDGREVEVEAESVAHLICYTAGLATDANSVPYVVLWSGADAGVVRDTAEIVLEAARTILSGSVFDCGKAA